MNTNIPAAMLAVIFSTGCTFARKTEKATTYISIGTQKQIKSLKYGDLEIHGLLSDESKGAEAAAKGAVQGITGNPMGFGEIAPAIKHDFSPNLLNLVPQYRWDDKTEGLVHR